MRIPLRNFHWEGPGWYGSCLEGNVIHYRRVATWDTSFVRATIDARLMGLVMPWRYYDPPISPICVIAWAN